MKHLQQSLNTDDDSFTYTVSGEPEPTYRVDSNAYLHDMKSGEVIGVYKLDDNQWHLFVDGVLLKSSGPNTMFKLPEFELDTLTALVNQPSKRMVTYKTIDSTDESEREFPDNVTAYQFIDTQAGLLEWWDMHDDEGNQLDSSV